MITDKTIEKIKLKLTKAWIIQMANIIKFSENDKWKDSFKKPEFIEILAINDDGNIVAIRDEAWMFQFITALD